MKIRKKLKLLLSIKRAKDSRQCLGLDIVLNVLKRSVGWHFDAHRNMAKEKKK